jgi:hypothetical protein
MTYAIDFPYGPNAMLGIVFGDGSDPLLPPERGLGAVGSIIRNNQVQDYTIGLLSESNTGGPISSALPFVGQDNILE